MQPFILLDMNIISPRNNRKLTALFTFFLLEWVWNLPCWWSCFFGCFLGNYKRCDDSNEDENVEDHDDQQWNIEEIKRTFTIVVNEASSLLNPNSRVKLWLWRQTDLKNCQGSSEKDRCPPSNGRVKSKLESSRSTAGQLRPAEGPIEIEAHDGHPWEHGDTCEVAAETNNSTKERTEFSVVHN